MYNRNLKKLILGKPLTKEDIYEELLAMCDDKHGGDCPTCLVYQYYAGSWGKPSGWHKCDCFKDSKKMYEFISKKLKEIKEKTT